MLELLDQGPTSDLECLFCGAPAASWDHLESIVLAKQYNPPGHVIGNLVPACRTCNERKGNQHGVPSSPRTSTRRDRQS